MFTFYRRDQGLKSCKIYLLVITHNVVGPSCQGTPPRGHDKKCDGDEVLKYTGKRVRMIPYSQSIRMTQIQLIIKDHKLNQKFQEKYSYFINQPKLQNKCHTQSKYIYKVLSLRTR